MAVGTHTEAQKSGGESRTRRIGRAGKVTLIVGGALIAVALTVLIVGRAVRPTRVRVVEQAGSHATTTWIQKDCQLTEANRAYIGLKVEDAEQLALSRGQIIRVISVDGSGNPVLSNGVPNRINIYVEKGIISAACEH
jgi:hypothetical protein